MRGRLYASLLGNVGAPQIQLIYLTTTVIFKPQQAQQIQQPYGHGSGRSGLQDSLLVAVECVDNEAQQLVDLRLQLRGHGVRRQEHRRDQV